jgi:hypothetical protein
MSVDPMEAGRMTIRHTSGNGHNESKRDRLARRCPPLTVEPLFGAIANKEARPA